MKTNIINLDIEKGLNYTIKAKQGDTKSRFLLFNLYDNSTKIDLSNKKVRCYGIKPDYKEIFNDLTIKNGSAILELTNQLLAVPGIVDLEIVLMEGEIKLSSIPFELEVIRSINSEDAIVSTNEFSALMKALESADKMNEALIETGKNLEGNYTPRLEALSSQMAETAKEVDAAKENNLYSNSKNIECYFKAESLHSGEYRGENAFNGDLFINSTANTSGWVNNSYGEWIEFYLPFGVVIGDSIAEGHPNAHGRLHTSTGSVDLDKPNEEGQISYYLEKLLNMNIYNHGIGGQLTDSILNRFNRDVFGEEEVELVPTRTLKNKCKFCVVVAGTNDILNNKPISFTINNLEQMIKKCEQNNIYGVFYTLGVCQIYTNEQVLKVKEINRWLKNRVVYSSHCSLFDYFDFVNDPNNDGKPKKDIMADGTHPTKTTYARIAYKIYDENILKPKISIIPKYLNISTFINPESDFVGLARPNILKIEYGNGIKKLISTNNSPLYQDEIPRDSVIESVKLTVIEGVKPYERPTVDLRNYAIGEIYCSDVLDVTGILGVGNIIPVPTLMGSIGANRIMLSDISYSQTDNIPYIYGITFRDSTIEKALTNDGICRIETIDICNEGDYIITTVGGRGKKSKNLETDSPIAKCIQYIGISGSYHKALVKLL